MCKELVVVNRCDLGNRLIGYELFNTEAREVIGKTEKQIKDCIKAGTVVKGFIVNPTGELVIDDTFVKNLIVKTGCGNLNSSVENSIVNLMYTVIGKKGAEFEVISSRFWQGTMTEEKVKLLLEMGAMNGVSIDENGKVQLVEVKEQQIPKGNNKSTQTKEVTA